MNQNTLRAWRNVQNRIHMSLALPEYETLSQPITASEVNRQKRLAMALRKIEKILA